MAVDALGGSGGGPVSDPELCKEIRAAMALCSRVAAGLAASPTGYQPPEPEEAR